jgi:DNA-binding PadR family transcriptional regulator
LDTAASHRSSAVAVGEDDTMSKITTTGYAMMGILSARARSTYELVQYMKESNLRAIWSPAESQVYKEPKRLAEEGLAESRVEFQGERKRTLYRATRAGRKALREWLGEPSQRFSYRSEAMVKVSFGDFGSVEDLSRNIQAIRDEAEDDARVMLEFAESRAERGPVARRRTHVNALVALFIIEMMEVRIRWASRALEFIQGWTEARGNEAAFEQGDAAWLEIHDRLKVLLADADRRAA